MSWRRCFPEKGTRQFHAFKNSSIGPQPSPLADIRFILTLFEAKTLWSSCLLCYILGQKPSWETETRVEAKVWRPAGLWTRKFPWPPATNIRAAKNLAVTCRFVQICTNLFDQTAWENAQPHQHLTSTGVRCAGDHFSKTQPPPPSPAKTNPTPD